MIGLFDYFDCDFSSDWCACICYVANDLGVWFCLLFVLGFGSLFACVWGCDLLVFVLVGYCDLGLRLRY